VNGFNNMAELALGSSGTASVGDVASPAALDIDAATEARLIAGARCAQPVRGLTHGFYKYPARFSPAFARAAIEAFTQTGDWVLDNHVGGGTTLVEALALGRNGVGVDISTLAEFITTTKTTVLDDAELELLGDWASRLAKTLNIRAASNHFTDFAELGYYRYLDDASRWRLRKAIELGIGAAVSLGSQRLEAFGRCAVLRTAQWALDGRKELPTFAQFRATLCALIREMIAGARELQSAAKASGVACSTHVLNRSGAGLENDARIVALPRPRLILTSPPYPGVHVLYHRWQVDGRKEAPLPFMIANKLDGAGSSYYTMGDRRYPELKTYFDNIRASMGSAASVANGETIVVQMVAFSDPSWQLEKYLKTMNEAGLTEVLLPSLHGQADGRLWRAVPSRRWYADQRGAISASNEVVLFHRTSAVTRPPQLHRTSSLLSPRLPPAHQSTAR